jgi:hypothetical protein
MSSFQLFFRSFINFHLKARRSTFSCNKLSLILHTNLSFKNAYSREQTKFSSNVMKYRLSDLMKYHSSNLMKYHTSNLMKYHSLSLMKYYSSSLMKYRLLNLMNRSSNLMKYNSSNLTKCCLSNLMSRFRQVWWVAFVEFDESFRQVLIISKNRIRSRSLFRKNSSRTVET